MAALKAEDYARGEASLAHFVRAAWEEALHPRKPFVGGWHIEAICKHLEAVTRGEITRLAINVPPRTSKSTIVSVLWPVWTWLANPSLEYLTGSHSIKLATRDTLASRRLLTSDWFRKCWGERIKLAGDQNEKMRYQIQGGGHRIAFGMGSGVTGEGGDVIIIDDPHPAKQGMWSEANRRAVKDMFDQELSTRLNDPDRSAIVIIMQRLHEGDLTGHVLAGEEPWEHLMLPMEFDPKRRCKTSLGVADPRTEPGELLQAERYPAHRVKILRQRLGAYGAAGQLDQSPAPAEGGVFKLEWFRRYGVLPSRDQWSQIVQCWDTAQKADEVLNAPWVCGTWIVTKDEQFYLAEVLRRWMDYPTGRRMVKSQWEKWRPHEVVIEDKSTGSSLLQEPDLRALPRLGFEPEGDKVTRAAVESPAVEAGKVWLPESAAWLADFEGELASFPASETKDQVDMLSMFLRHVRERRGRGPRVVKLF
ncbi:phage terminase large subunit [Desulfarculus baarsii]